MLLGFRPGMDRSGGGGHSVEMARMCGFRRDPKLDTPRGRDVPAAAEFVRARCGDAPFGSRLKLLISYMAAPERPAGFRWSHAGLPSLFRADGANQLCLFFLPACEA
jgi:hypothetical protein